MFFGEWHCIQMPFILGITALKSTEQLLKIFNSNEFASVIFFKKHCMHFHRHIRVPGILQQPLF